MLKTLYKQSGFTLIELAIVLVIIGVLAGAFLSTLGARIETTRRAEAKKEMEVIKQALYGYAMSQTNPHLPCPDCRATSSSSSCPSTGNTLNDGIEDRDAATGLCDTNNDVGNIPWQTLGLGSGDPWGDRYSYWVSSSAADSAGFALGPPGPAMTNKATIQTRVGNTLTNISTSAVAVIETQGKDGYGGISVKNITRPTGSGNVDEKDNLDNNLTFISRAPSKAGATTAGGEFDDMLVWVSEYELKAKMVEAGVMP